MPSSVNSATEEQVQGRQEEDVKLSFVDLAQMLLQITGES